MKVQERRKRLAGHCIQHNEEMANRLALWQPTEGKTERGRRRVNYVDNLLQDDGMDNVEELRKIMEDGMEEACGRCDAS